MTRATDFFPTPLVSHLLLHRQVYLLNKRAYAFTNCEIRELLHAAYTRRHLNYSCFGTFAEYYAKLAKIARPLRHTATRPCRSCYCKLSNIFYKSIDSKNYSIFVPENKQRGEKRWQGGIITLATSYFFAIIYR